MLHSISPVWKGENNAVYGMKIHSVDWRENHGMENGGLEGNTKDMLDGRPDIRYRVYYLPASLSYAVDN